MLHIILTLLKIIVVFLLILLGLLLLLIILVLAAPVTYDFSGEWDGKPHLQGKIHWLYHIVGISVHMKDMQPEIQLTIFGRNPGSGRKKAGTGDKRKNTELAEELSDTEDRKNLDEADFDEQPFPDEKAVSEEKKEQKEQTLTEKLPVTEEVQDIPSVEGDVSGETETEDIEPEDEYIGFEDDNETGGPEEKVEKQKSSESDKGNQFPDMVRSGIDFFNQPSVRKLISRLWGSIRRIFRHLRPSKLQIRARIGMDDPALTGKIMEFAAILYAFYHENIEIVSEFDEKVLEGRFSVRGWLVPGYLIIKFLGMALRILLNRECRAFYREIKENLA